MPAVVDSSPIRVLIVDDHRIVREGLQLIVERETDMCVVASVATGEEAIVAFERERPDVVLMDLQLAEMSGVEAIRGIRKSDPNARVVVLTVYAGDEDIFRAIDVGAITYLLKDALSADLIHVIREVHAGLRPMPPDVQARLDSRATRPTLTEREIEVLRYVLEGNRNKEIAAILSIREDSVEGHLKHIFAKLDVHDRTAAVYLALRRGILHLAVRQ